MQHFRRLAATAVITGLLGLAAMEASAQEGGGFTQRGVTVEATAENAVVAKTRALAAAQRQAFEKMAAELGIGRSASDSQIDALVDSIIIEQERSTRTGYNGRLTVNFNPRRTANFGGVSAGAASAGAGSGASGGGTPASTGDAAHPVTPPGLAGNPANMAFNPASSFVESAAGFGGMAEWLDLRRRLLAGPEVASVEIVAIAVDGARLRLGLRLPPAEAAQGLATRGLVLRQAGGVPPAGLAAPVRPGALPVPVAAAGAGWQVGFAGRV